MKTIVFDAIPFCYGPAAAMLSLGHALSARGFAVTAVVAGSTAELVSQDKMFTVISCTNDVDVRVSTLRTVLPQAAAYVNVVDPETYAGVADIAVPKIYVDFLFWMTEPDTGSRVLDADLYLIENYPGALAKLEKHRSLLRNPVLVPPLIEISEGVREAPRHRKLLVCLGGLESPLTHVGGNTDYPYVIVPLVLEAAQRMGQFEEIVVTGARDVMRELARRHPSGAAFRQLPHHEFLSELRTASVLVSHPGLYAPFEGFASGVPTVLLPSSNYTQILQLRFYREAGVALDAIDWEDMGIVPATGRIEALLPEHIGVSRVLECVRGFGQNPRAQVLLCEKLTVTLKAAIVHRQSFIDRQTAFYKRLVYSSGPEAAADAVMACIG